MRMWPIDPARLCRAHLLGEHREMHALAGSMRLNKSLAGYLRNNLIDPSQVNERHDALADEIAARGWNHQSPLDPVSGDPHALDVDAALQDLWSRCTECRALSVV